MNRFTSFKKTKISYLFVLHKQSIHFAKKEVIYYDCMRNLEEAKKEAKKPNTHKVAKTSTKF